MYVEKIRRSCFGKSGFQKSRLKKSIFVAPLKILMLSNVITVVPQGFFQIPRLVLLKDSATVFFKIHRKASFTTKHIYALAVGHIFTEKKFNNMNFEFQGDWA